MNDNVNNKNPFAGLFTAISDSTNSSAKDHNTATDKVTKDSASLNSQELIRESEKDELLDELIANVFGITLHHNEKRKKPSRQLIYIDTESVEQAVFERLLLTEPESCLISKSKGEGLDSHVIQTEIIPYLFESYCRLMKYNVDKESQDITANIHKIIMCDVSTALQEPSIFENQQVCKC